MKIHTIDVKEFVEAKRYLNIMNRSWDLCFFDKDKNFISLSCGVKCGCFSISGEISRTQPVWGNSKGKRTILSPYVWGQIQNEINPISKEQKKLLKFWNEYHLNDFTAGTPKQEKMLKSKKFIKYLNRKRKKRKSFYDCTCYFLKKHRMYTEKGYKYGSSWLKKKLPNNFIRDLRRVVLKIKKDYENYQNNY